MPTRLFRQYWVAAGHLGGGVHDADRGPSEYRLILFARTGGDLFDADLLGYGYLHRLDVAVGEVDAAAARSGVAASAAPLLSMAGYRMPAVSHIDLQQR